MNYIQKATLVYIDNGKEWLMLHRNKREHDVHFGKWIAVGGKFKDNEKAIECATREVFEETGLTITNIDEKGIILFENFTPNTDWQVHVFLVKKFVGQLVDSDEGELSWVPYENIMSLPTWEGDYIFNQWLLDNKPYFKAIFKYEANELVEYKVSFE